MRRAEGGTKIFGVFRVKNHDFTPYAKKRIFFPILGKIEYSLVLIVSSVKYNRRSEKNIDNCFFHINLRPGA